MQIIVIGFNVILASYCLVWARRLWLFRLSLQRSTQVLLLTEMAIHDALKDAPSLIAQGQFNLRQWNQFLAQLGFAIRQGRIVLAWARQGQRLGGIMISLSWRWRCFKVRSSS